MKMHFDDLAFPQVGWCGILGYWIFVDAMRVVGRDPGCFTYIGVYSVCYSTESISIYVTLFVLMIQASIIRIVVPGMSIFVNESVRPSRIRVALCPLIYFLFSLFVSLTHCRFCTETALPMQRLLRG